MAATISVNFATVQEVFSISPPNKKSVSAKVLADALGGGVVGGGYVRRTGDDMKGYLTLVQSTPQNPYHAATKKYVDDHAYTRRYRYECSSQDGNGRIKTGSDILSGFDLFNNTLYFYERDDQSVENIFENVDVYRNGILQTFGGLPYGDFRILNIPGFTPFPGISAIQFYQPFSLGETFQVNIGNTGGYPYTFGVERLYGDFGIVTNRLSGEVTLNVTPSSFVATDQQVSNRNGGPIFLTPTNLSAYPLAPRAGGLFVRKTARAPRITDENENPRYGDVDGLYQSQKSYNIISVQSGGDNDMETTQFKVKLQPGTFSDTNYNAIIFLESENYDTLAAASAVVRQSSKTVNSFDFFVYDAFLLPPEDIIQISILVF